MIQTKKVLLQVIASETDASDDLKKPDVSLLDFLKSKFKFRLQRFHPFDTMDR